jgi:hypothetical protein
VLSLLASDRPTVPEDRRTVPGPEAIQGEAMIQRRQPIARSTKPIARGKRPRRQRATPLATLKRQLWALFSAYVKDRDGDGCVTCIASGLEGSNWHAGHWISGSRQATKYDPKNVHSQCGRCNIWLRGNGAEYSGFILQAYGAEEHDRMLRKSRELKNWTRPELEYLIAAAKRGGADYETAYYERYL